jgi:putative oxidoreductase
MKKLTRVNPSDVASHTNRFVFLRMALGILLFIKGIDFISNSESLQELLAQQKNAAIKSAWLTFAVGWAQLFGGIFIVLGLFTRVVCLLQLPIVAFALLIQFSNYTLSDFALLQIIAVFSGLTLFLEKGGGTISLDRYFRFNQSNHLVFWS